MMRVPNGSLARSRPQKEHGRHIYAYCNVTTNQVLYSLTQNLQGNRSLKQLPDAGANNNPPKLRKDLWRPLWSVTLPDGKNGLAQGLHAFKKLRELRKLHELSWKPPPELARPTSQEEIDEMQRALDDRGGSKIDTVYDIIKKKKKKIRQRMVMDQKANSVADLAAVLIQHDELGAKTAEEKRLLSKTERDSEVAEMLRLAREARNGALEKIDAQIEALVSRRQAKKEGKTDDEASNRSMMKGIHALEKQKRKTQFAANAVAAAEQGYTWLPNSQMTSKDRDKALRERVRSLREEINARREAEAAALPETDVTAEQPLDGLASEEAIVDAQVDGFRQTYSGTASERAQILFQHGAKELALELEMIRRLHSRPDRIATALNAYTARPGDIDQLRRLASHWETMFQMVLTRYEEKLTHWRELEAAVDGGEGATKALLTAQDRYPVTQTGELDFAEFQRQRPARKLRIHGIQDAVNFLQGLVHLTSQNPSVEEVEEKLHQDATVDPTKHADFVLRVSERGRGSQLKVMGRARARATILAKAKVEARVAELQEELESGAVVETAREDLAEEAVEAKAEAMGEDGETQSEQLAEPTNQELDEAVHQVRRLSIRVHDVNNIAAYEAAVEQLSRDEPLDYELKSNWESLDLQQKRKKYEAYLSDLKQWAPTLQRARQLLAESDGVEKLVKAAEDARERSMAARNTGEERIAQEQKQRAKMFETVADLRDYEDVILRAPEVSAEKLAEEQEQERTVQASGGAQDVATEAQESETSQKSKHGSETDAQPAEAPSTVDYHALLPSFPEKTTLPKHSKDAKKNEARQTLLRLRAPVFTAAGVTVRWNNMLDAEYAESWPQEVQHQPMGLSRHTAPRFDQAPIFDVGEFKNQPGGGYKGKKFERMMERKMVRERVGGITERVMEAVVAREGERERATEAEKRKLVWAGRQGEREAAKGFEIGEAQGEGEKPVQA